MTDILAQDNPLATLKVLPAEELPRVAEELRGRIIRTVAENGGHLASSLGVVELTIALHRVFDSPHDKIVWDVGHQAYAHKLLTGRAARFHTLRQLDGISGFPKRAESPHDSFDVGHSGTSISVALGMAAARDTAGGGEKIVAVIGDGSLTGGIAFEAINHAGHLKSNLVVILNDNEMSISPNVGALSAFMSRTMTSELFRRARRETEQFLGHLPRFGKELIGLVQRAEHSLKGFLTPGMLFEAFGFEYVGPIDGHRLDDLIETLRNAARLEGPVLIHILTKKGKGYGPAEQEPARFHGIGPFDPATGVAREVKGGPTSYTGVFGRTLVELAESDLRVVAVTAAMPDGTGLQPFAERYPSRFFDVGIAEQHAVTFAAGMAARGLRPVVAIYSSFMQRAYDSVIHDVCLQNLPVIFALDRGGLVGADGPTHHGTFDLSFLRPIPNLTVMAPRDEHELRRALITALGHDGPFALRYPRGAGEGVDLGRAIEPLTIGCGEKLRDGKDGVICAVGVGVPSAMAAAELLGGEGLELTVVDARFIKPLDAELLVGEAVRTGRVITVEENALMGGFGSAVLECLAEKEVNVPVLRVGLPDIFVEQGSQSELRRRYELDAEGLAARIRTFFKE
ncbi:MAG: 1-deoxy-D-xylulose-5-phosphate synthase [Desulfuromonadales bacterium]|nr:1-deoxy-D-xylulose-5-phosphate synthase [Desulfuromonadales bacterium]